MCVCVCLAGFAPADRVMDLFIVACGLCVMYEIHLKFSVLNEALTCLHMGERRLEGPVLCRKVNRSCSYLRSCAGNGLDRGLCVSQASSLCKNPFYARSMCQ